MYLPVITEKANNVNIVWYLIGHFLAFSKLTNDYDDITISTE